MRHIVLGASYARTIWMIDAGFLLRMMRIFVTAKPNAFEDRLEWADEAHCCAWVRAAAEKGKANIAVQKLIAAHFGIAASRVRIVQGASSSRKVVEIS